MNLASESVVIIGMLTATLIGDERLLALLVVAIGDKITVYAVRIRITDEVQ